MNQYDIIANSLIDFDTTQDVVAELEEKMTLLPNFTSSDFKRSSFKFIDEASGNVVVETDVEVLAMYSASQDLLKYALGLQPELSHIKSILTTSKGLINDPIQIGINLAISSSYLKQPYIYRRDTVIGSDILYTYYILFNKEKLDNLKQKINKVNK